MPRIISSKVKERRPDTLEDTAQWADDSWESLGWNYDTLPNGDVRAQDKFKKKPYSSNHSHRVSSPECVHRFHEHNRRAAEKTYKNRTTVETDDFHKDKDHRKGVRRCYICQKTGHYKADCPLRNTTSLYQHNSLEKINLNVLPSRREELKLAENYIKLSCQELWMSVL